MLFRRQIRSLDFSGFGNADQELELVTLTDVKHASEPDVTDSFAEPRRVAPVESKFAVAAPKFDYRFAPPSLTVLRWKLR